jgi:hypothetical protein
MKRSAVQNGNGRTAPVKVFCGLILCFAVLAASGTWKVAASAAGFWALATALLRHPGPVPWWYHMLAAAPGGVIGALLIASLRTPANLLDFAMLRPAVSTGMMVGFVTGVGLSLMIRGIRGWRAGSTIAALGLAFPIIILSSMAVDGMCACTTKEKAYIATMKSDLRNLAMGQENHFAEHGLYASDIRSVTDYATSHGVRVEIVAALPTGWYATAAHELTPVTCAIYYGEGVPTSRASPGVFDCD